MSKQIIKKILVQAGNDCWHQSFKQPSREYTGERWTSKMAGALFTHQQWFARIFCPQMCRHSTWFSSLMYDEVNVKTPSEEWAHARGHFWRQGRRYLSVPLSWLISIRKESEMWQHWRQMTAVCRVCLHLSCHRQQILIVLAHTHKTQEHLKKSFH